jgi:hypothetical protein
MPKKESGRRGSNPRPAAWKAAALPTELLPRIQFQVSSLKFSSCASIEPNFKLQILNFELKVVGEIGFEPMKS